MSRGVSSFRFNASWLWSRRGGNPMLMLEAVDYHIAYTVLLRSI